MGRSAARTKYLNPTGETRSDIDDEWILVAPVGTFEPNPWGLHDVHGNVLEGCSNGPYEYGNSPTDPLSPSVQACMVRGGSNQFDVIDARSAWRMRAPINHDRNEAAGLRPAREFDPQ